MILGCAEEWGCPRISGSKVVSEGRQHHDEVVASVCQRKNTKVVKDVCSVGDCGKQPVKVILVDALREECDNSENFTGDGTEVAECWGGEREFYGRFKAIVASCPKHLRSAHAPLLGQSIVGPHVVSCSSCEQCD